MNEFYTEVLKPFLTNEIVITWVSPIITGLIVVAIPAVLIWVFKVLQIKRDEKKINAANQRFIDAIRPYIIQNIDILPNFITDIRTVIVEESGVKDKFVYSELGLRNKIIMDINESKYIDETNKEKLIIFSYDTFKSFEQKKEQIVSNKEVSKASRKMFLHFIPMEVYLILLSMILMIIANFFHDPSIKYEEDPLVLLPFFLGIISSLILMVSSFIKTLESRVMSRRYSKFAESNDSYVYNLINNYILKHKLDDNGNEKNTNKGASNK